MKLVKEEGERPDVFSLDESERRVKGDEPVRHVEARSQGVGGLANGLAGKIGS